jgi:hypothetical protein
MNYFGHVALAGRFSGSAEFLFGSMLPDWAGIVGCATPQCAHAAVQLGVSFHLISDAEFHQAPIFRTRVSDICRQLESRGMRKAPARAVSHVGFELLLDAELGKTPIHMAAFQAALRVAGPNAIGAHLKWSSRDASDRFENLRLRLIERNSCRDFFAADRIVDRLVYTLRRRPRLCLLASERDILREWINHHFVPAPDELVSLWVQVCERVANRWNAPFARTSAASQILPSCNTVQSATD